MTKEEKILKKWETLTIKDNFIFGKTMELNPSLCKRLIEQILKIKVKSLTYPEREKNIEARLDSKGIRLDVYVEDENNRSFNIEIQLTDNDDLAKRMRYYHALIDLDKLHKGKTVKYKNLGESYVIFICMFDVFGYGYQMYDFENVCKRNSEIKLNDGTHKIFLCAEGNDGELDEDIKNFLDYVAGRGIKSEFIQEMDDTVKRVKNSNEGRLAFMIYELMLQEREERGEERGRKIGEKLGIEKTLIENLRSIMETLQVNAEKAMEILKVPKDEQNYYLSKLNS